MSEDKLYRVVLVYQHKAHLPLKGDSSVIYMVRSGLALTSYTAYVWNKEKEEYIVVGPVSNLDEEFVKDWPSLSEPKIVVGEVI